MTQCNNNVPDSHGNFGQFGGMYVPETLIAALHQLDAEYTKAKNDPAFQGELDELLRHYVGRATPLYHAKRLTEHVGGAQIYLKREDLTHTGAHKINNTLGQGLLTLRMGKKRVIAETGAGQHGVGTATAAALLGLECDVYMGSEDMRRQHPNVVRMELLGARCIPVNSGSCTLKDATNEAMRDWMGSVEQTHYIIGSVVGPHPFPMMVRDFQSVIGKETRKQCLDQIGQLPDTIIACVGGGSNAAGIFYPFINDADVQMIGVEAGGRSTKLGDHAAPLQFGEPGVLHGSMSYVLQNKDGQTATVHSISAGLDYPGVGPEHSYWKEANRVSYFSCTDDQAMEAFELLAKCEGILPALESSHALWGAMQQAKEMTSEQILVVNLSGRGDKDIDEIMKTNQQTNISKTLSYVLRHRPDAIGITLDNAGWTNVDELLESLAYSRLGITLEQLKFVVKENNKQRFEFNDDFTHIRARQGHSLDVNLGYEPTQPPAILYHGTTERFVQSILANGLNKGKRHHVHMSTDKQLMLDVGSRRGKPSLIRIEADKMNLDGYVFYQTENKVWLTDHVPAKYLTVL